MISDISEFEEKIKYRFKNKDLALQALTHTSYANDYLGDPNFGNERLEFLGDAILDAVVGAALYDAYPDKQEGFLTKLRAEIVCEDSLAKAAFALGLNEFLRLGKGEENLGGREKPSIIADSVEAIIAAVFVDGGIEEAVRVTHIIMDDIIAVGEKGLLPKDCKSALQEQLQKKGQATPTYKILGESGPDHDKRFRAGVFLGKDMLAEGEGKSKKEAEIAAAAKALDEIKKK